MYVRVINRSNRTLNPNEAKVILYWSKLVNTKLWPDVWVGDVSIQGLPVGGIIPNDYGGLDGKPNVSTVKPGEEFVVTFQWDVPNPDDFVGKGFDFDKCDFSLLARVITASDPIDPIAESANIWANVKNSNNIAWKSVTVENGNGDDCPDKGISISNFDDESKVYSLEFSVDDTEIGKAIYEEAEVIIQLQESLYQKWSENGSIKENLIENNNQSFKVIGNHVIIDNIPLASQEVRSFKISFNFLADELTEKDEFKYHFL